MTTPPRGGGGGSSPARGLSGSRASSTTRRGTSSASDFTDIRLRDAGSDRWNDPWSPANVLVDMVARMQQDLADLRAENRLLRTPGVPPVVHTPRQAAFTTMVGRIRRWLGHLPWSLGWAVLPCPEVPIPP